MSSATTTYQQVRDILDRVRSIHRRLRDALERVRPTSKDQRTKLLLESIRRDEQDMNIALARYQRQGGKSALETWIQYIPDEETQRLLNDTHFTADMSPAEMLGRKSRIDDALVELYRSLAEQSSAPRVAELFDGLARQTSQRITNQNWRILDSDSAPKSEK